MYLFFCFFFYFTTTNYLMFKWFKICVKICVVYSSSKSCWPLHHYYLTQPINYIRYWLYRFHKKTKYTAWICRFQNLQNDSMASRFKRFVQCEQSQIPTYKNSFKSRTQPSLTSRAPPCTFFTPIIFKGSRSSSIITASTTILEKKSFCPAISFEFIAVAAHFSNNLLCSLWWQERRNDHLCDIYVILTHDYVIAHRVWTHCSSSFLTVTAISLIFLTASWVAVRKALMMVWGWSPSSTYGFNCFRNSAASRVTEVVPSPTWIYTKNDVAHYTLQRMMNRKGKVFN